MLRQVSNIISWEIWKFDFGISHIMELYFLKLFALHHNIYYGDF
jgi:hypothetical protein